MSGKKVTDVMLERIKYFVNAIENGEYEPKQYEFTIKLNLQYPDPNCGGKTVTISDNYSILEK